MNARFSTRHYGQLITFSVLCATLLTTGYTRLTANIDDVDSAMDNATRVTKIEAIADQSSFKTKVFNQGNAAFLSTLSGRPFLTVRYQFRGENQRFKFVKDLNAHTAENNYGVVRWHRLGYGSCTKGDFKLPGARDSIIGSSIANALTTVGFLPLYSYEENPLVELYQENVPMMWQVKSVDELRSILGQLDARLKELSVSPNKNAILVLRINGDPQQRTVTATDRKLLNKYFRQFSLDDEEVHDFFETMQEHMNEENYTLEGAGPEWVYESFLEGLFRMTEKQCVEFKVKRALPIIVTLMAATMIKDPAMKFFSKDLPGITSRTMQRLMNIASDIARNHLSLPAALSADARAAYVNDIQKRIYKLTTV